MAATGLVCVGAVGAPCTPTSHRPWWLPRASQSPSGQACAQIPWPPAPRNMTSACVLCRRVCPPTRGLWGQAAAGGPGARASRPWRARTPCRLAPGSSEGLHFPAYLAARGGWATTFWPMRCWQSILGDSGKSSSSGKADVRAGAPAAMLDPEAKRVGLKEPQALEDARALVIPHSLRPAQNCLHMFTQEESDHAQHVGSLLPTAGV